MENIFNSGTKQLGMGGKLQNVNQMTGLEAQLNNQSEVAAHMANAEMMTNQDIQMQRAFNQMELTGNQMVGNQSKAVNMEANKQHSFGQPGFMPMPTQIHPMLNNFKYSTTEQTTEKPVEQKETVDTTVYQEIIDQMESQADPRFKNSRFLGLMKDLRSGNKEVDKNSNTIKDTGRTISTPVTSMRSDEEEMERTWSRIEENMKNLTNTDVNSLVMNFAKNNPNMTSESDLLEKAKAHLAKNETKEALLCLEAEVQKNSDNSEAWHLLGKVHTEFDRDDVALHCFNNAIRADPFNCDAFHSLGICCVNEFDEFDAMIHLLTWIERHHVYSKFMDKSNSALDYGFIQKELETDSLVETTEDRNRKIMSLKNNFYSAVLDLLEAVAKEYPKDEQIWSALGIGHFIPLNSERAIQCFQQLLAVNPSSYENWNKMGAILAHSNREKESLDSYQKALSIKPNYVRCNVNIGIAQMNGKNFEAAVSYFLKALMENDQSETSWSLVINCLNNMGRKEDAVSAYKKDLNSLKKYII